METRRHGPRRAEPSTAHYGQTISSNKGEHKNTWQFRVVNNIQQHQCKSRWYGSKITKREKNNHRYQVAETENKKPLYLERVPMPSLALQKPAWISNYCTWNFESILVIRKIQARSYKFQMNRTTSIYQTHIKESQSDNWSLTEKKTGLNSSKEVQKIVLGKATRTLWGRIIFLPYSSNLRTYLFFPFLSYKSKA